MIRDSYLGKRAYTQLKLRFDRGYFAITVPQLRLHLLEPFAPLASRKRENIFIYNVILDFGLYNNYRETNEGGYKWFRPSLPPFLAR